MFIKSNIASRRRRLLWFVAALYGAELLDELIYGLQSVALPHLRGDLALSYTQVGLLFTVPGLIGLAGDPVVGLLGDTRHRRALVLGGIAATALGLMLVAAGQTYVAILLAFVVLYLASGAYVDLAQATLIDLNPSRAEGTMARWTLLGAVGVTVAPLIATAAFYLGYGWRGLFWALAGAAGLYLALMLRCRFDAHAGAAEPAKSPLQSGRALLDALRHPQLLRWIVLTELADLMLDKLLEVTALYFHDVVGVSLAAASAAVGLSTLAGLAGNALVVPVLDRVRGAQWLRATAVIALAAYVLLLLVSAVWLKYALIALISLCAAGWYPILRARCFDVLPGQSGLILAATSLGNFSGLFVPLAIGRLADAFGLRWAMWLLAIGPASLILGLPAREPE